MVWRSCPQACFSATFLKNCGRAESLGVTTCPKTVAGGKQGHAPVKYFRSNKVYFLSVKFHGDHIAVKKLR